MNAAETGSFRFRTFAPLLPERRAVLTGHSGLVACGLAGDNVNDSMLISIAGQSASNGGNTLGACDVRLWNLPADDTMPCCKFHCNTIGLRTPLKYLV
ncbi:hypothetical protein AHF37_11673 [Paragonimus kellicotti]|nr:hypothetical protein AHF37_11673 [Paragonimus kellicotti]